MTQRVNLYLEDDFAEQLRERKPRSLSLSAFCAWMIEDHLKSLDSVAKLATCSAGAEDPHIEHIKEQVVDQTQDQLQDLPLVSEKVLPSPDVVFGRGVGRESEGNPRGTAFKPIIPDVLKQHEDFILDFWRIKQGSKGSRAWSLLMTELGKIHKQHGHDVVRQQIELAINGKWKGITLANFNRFDHPQKPAQQQSDFKHPASRVFTAKDGFEGPATNPVLKELF